MRMLRATPSRRTMQVQVGVAIVTIAVIGQQPATLGAGTVSTQLNGSLDGVTLFTALPLPVHLTVTQSPAHYTILVLDMSN